jgi:hypothetical protein
MSKNDVELVVVSEGGPEAGLGEATENQQATSAPEKKKVLSTFELWSHIAIYLGLFICFFFFVASIVTYFVFTENFRERINAIDDVSLQPLSPHLFPHLSPSSHQSPDMLKRRRIC